MRKSKFTEKQIMTTPKQVEAGAKVAEATRKRGVTEQTLYRREAEYSGTEVSDATRLRELEDENRRLKQMVAEQALDLQALRNRPKKMVRPAALRRAVGLLRERFRFSERRACRVLQFARCSHQYRSRGQPEARLVATLRRLAAERPGFGTRRLHTLLGGGAGRLGTSASTDDPSLEVGQSSLGRHHVCYWAINGSTPTPYFYQNLGLQQGP
jgi:putative transposase